MGTGSFVNVVPRETRRRGTVFRWSGKQRPPVLPESDSTERETRKRNARRRKLANVRNALRFSRGRRLSRITIRARYRRRRVRDGSQSRHKSRAIELNEKGEEKGQVEQQQVVVEE